MPKEVCVDCGKELGLMKFKPKKEWGLTGNLCHDCFNKRSTQAKTEGGEERIPAQPEPSINREAWTGPKWEYMIEPMVRLLSKWSLDKIDELGKEGWEAVGIFYDAKISQTYVLLKRPMG
jgi:NMD protein affecting ribosome stability and mRNA decay